MKIDNNTKTTAKPVAKPSEKIEKFLGKLVDRVKEEAKQINPDGLKKAKAANEAQVSRTPDRVRISKKNLRLFAEGEGVVEKASAAVQRVMKRLQEGG
ncbi:MAG: hypothetical protein KGJ02_00695 [Verrucomicrobiota bacterium]|nr:hypothetical protein [Verrucomicrobiota bacterium]